MFKIGERRDLIPDSLLDGFRAISPGALGHHIESGAMDGGLRPIQAGAFVLGVALTVQTLGRDSTICHKAIDFVRPGDVIVIDRGGDNKYACWGEMTSLAAHLHGAVGVILDGPVTDVQAIRNIGLSVFCRGTSALTTQLLGNAGSLNVAVTCGGVVVHPGDLILGDENGIIVISPDEAEFWLEVGSREEEADARYRQDLMDGKLPSELAPIDELMLKATSTT